MKKQFLSMILAIAMLLALCPAAIALADDSLPLVEETYVPDTDLPGSEELFSGYLEKQMGGGISMFSTGLRTAGSRLTGDAKAMYDGLKPYMQKLAAGEITSAVITMGKQVGTTVPMIEYAFTTKVGNETTGPLLDALLLDMPYEMYWFEKTRGIQSSYYLNGKGNTELMTISFHVVDAYQGANDFTLNARPASVATAVANAKKVVSDNASKSDYEKLKAYKEYICNAVDYNDAAASDNYTGGFGDPWQLIYVFDGNTSTKVVCEGYAKAFQYLCDMTAWNGDVQCYSASGMMVGGTGAGPHMWNIVTIGGKSYIVDVTNSDAGSVGQDGELFLGGTAGSIAAGYTFACGSQNVAFTYDLDTTSMWGNGSDSILKLEGENYDPSKEPVVEKFTVTFVDGQGNKLSTQTVESGKAATAPTNPTREGYTFTGWDKTFTNITKDTTVTAQWKVNQYTITFNTDGGSDIAAITQNYGTKVNAPAAPTKTGYTFAGWDVKIPETMPAKNMTITAKWTVNTYAVTFVDGQGNTLKTQTVEHGKAATAPAAPTWAGHTFTGWDKTFDKITADTTVTAKWDVVAYTVTFVDGQGNKLAEQKVESGKAATAPADPTREGYTFTGWDKTFTNITADTTVTAQWTAKTYTVTFVDGNGKTLSTQTVEHGKAATAPAAPTWAGHTFAGWDKAFDKITADTTVTAKWDVVAYTVTFVDGQGNKLAEQKVESGKAATAPADPTRAGYTFTGWDKTFDKITADTTVTAQWAAKTYTVTFVDGNGKTLSTQTVEHGKAATAPAAPTWAGHSFTGWDKAFDKITADTTVTAKWDVVTYTVTVTNGNGSGKYAAGAAVTIAAKAPEAGMKFTGWKGLDGLTITQGSADAAYLTFTMPAEDVSVSAVFEKAAEDKYTVSFDGNGGTGSMADVEMTAGTFTLPECTMAAPAGKQFKAWLVNGVEYAVGSKISVSANMTVEAVWENIPVQGSAPVITAPTAAKTVSVYEGEKGEMSITAKDAIAYQWYINRQDGKGYVAIKDAVTVSYTTSVVAADNDGYTYYCVASNKHGQVQSPVFTLEVLEITEVPPTGDNADIALWLALVFISAAGLTVIASKARKSRIS